MPFTPDTRMPQLDAGKQERQHEERLLTTEEKKRLEQEKIHVLKDLPEILYCSSDEMHYGLSRMGALGEIAEKTKPVLCLVKRYGLSGDDLLDDPSLQEAIGSVLEVGSRTGKILEEYKYPTDRSVMDKIKLPQSEANPFLNTPEDKEFLFLMSHRAGNQFIETHEKPGNTGVRLELLIAEEDKKGFDLPWDLEALSSVFLEPHFRSSNSYSDYGLDRNRLDILYDLDTLKRVYEEDPDVQRVVKRYFDGDLEAFQKRWQEFYKDWWPKEFEIARDTEQKWLDWLKALKEKIASKPKTAG